jgi:hypothetical protein
MIQDQIRYATSFMFPIVTFALTIDEYLVKPNLIWVKERRPIAHAARQRPDRPLGDQVPRVGRRTDRYPIGAQT